MLKIIIDPIKFKTNLNTYIYNFELSGLELKDIIPWRLTIEIKLPKAS